MPPANDDAARREKFIHHVRFFDAASRYPSPYIGFTGQPGQKFELHCLPYDAAGFLNPEPIGPRTDPDEIRVFVVGDSTMATGAAWKDTVPGRINDLLRAEYSPRVRVYNFGVVSSCTEQMLALIWTRLLDLDPDLLVIASGGTDAFQPFSFDPRPGYPYNFFIEEFLYTHYFDEKNDKSWQSGLDYDAVIAAAFDLQTRLRQGVGYGTAGWEAGVARSFTGSLIKLVRLARAVDIPVVYFLEPIVVRQTGADVSEKRFGSPEALAYLARQYDRFEAALREVRTHRLPGNLRLIDASRAINEIGPGAFYDILHYDADGHATVGRCFTDHLLDVLRERGGRRTKGGLGRWMRRVLPRRALSKTARR